MHYPTSTHVRKITAISLFLPSLSRLLPQYCIDFPVYFALYPTEHGYSNLCTTGPEFCKSHIT